MKHVVCYSGGHSSAIVAIEVARRYFSDEIILLNHDIHVNVESEDIKRFKREVSDYLKLPITYANHPDFPLKDQFDVCIDRKAFQDGRHQAFCTYQLKTLPFQKYLQSCSKQQTIVYYGFDKNEKHRIQRRSSILSEMGYKSDYPLALWTERTITSTREIGIEPPNTYSVFKHANCTGCLKAGKQHWYIVYLTREDIWNKAKQTEEFIGYSILRGAFLEELEPTFAKMKSLNINTTEHEPAGSFFAKVKKLLKQDEEDTKPCECTF